TAITNGMRMGGLTGGLSWDSVPPLTIWSTLLHPGEPNADENLATSVDRIFWGGVGQGAPPAMPLGTDGLRPPVIDFPPGKENGPTPGATKIGPYSGPAGHPEDTGPGGGSVLVDGHTDILVGPGTPNDGTKPPPIDPGKP